jgi:hypothetical protein
MLMAEPAIEEVEFAARFRNWVRWCLAKGLYQGRTGSIEGAYRSPQHWDPPEPRPEPVDELDAILMNKAYVRLWMGSETAARVIQVLVFTPYLRPTRQAQILGTHYMRLEQELAKAKKMMQNLLR